MLTDGKYKKVYKIESYYSNEEIDYARKNPVILHTYRFLGEFPWHKNNFHPDNEIFDKYMCMSTQKDYEKKEANVGPLMKVEKFLFRFLPDKCFFTLFRAAQYMSFKIQNSKLEN